MEENEILTRDKAAPLGILPTGRKVGVTHSRGVGMYELKFTDEKGGELPDEIKGRFTGIHYAQKELKRYVEAMWDISDNAARKNKKTLSINTPVTTNAVG
jgi:hypothetical protein